MGTEADGPDGIRRAVRQTFKDGADFIKITASGGGTRGTARHKASFTPAELAAAVEEAQAHDSYVTAHCHAIEAIVRCLDAGVPMLEHATFIAEDGKESFRPEIAQRLVDQDVAVVPTVSIHGRWLEQKTVTGPPELVARRDDKAASFERRVRLVGQLYDAGVTVLIGSDAGFGRGYPAPVDDLGYEMQLHAAAGIPNLQVIAAATGLSARRLGIADHTGQLKAGLKADVIAVGGDPASDITSMQHVRFVMSLGRVVRNDF
jgi:imidazolonepropionase-like amidohydrolase